MKYYASVGGDDSNQGRSPDDGFRTVTRAVSALEPGDELFLREGTYVERVLLDHLGAAGSPIVIRSFPGEHATIDGALEAFRTAPNGDWKPGERADEYVSEQTYPPGTDHGAFLDRPDYTRLITYSNLNDLRALNQRFGPLPDTQDDPPGPIATDADDADLPKRPWVYMGPGLFQDTCGRIHVRLSHTTHDVQGVSNYTGARDPRKVRLAIWTEPVATLLISHCTSVHIRDVTVRFGGGRTVKIDASTDVRLDHVRILAGPYGVQVGEACRDTSISDCEVDGGLPPWYFRSDRKDGYTYEAHGVRVRNDLGKRTLNALLRGSPDCVGTKITRCEFVNGHDLYLFGKDLEFSRNWISNLNDEAMTVDGVAVDRLRIFENVLERCLSALSFAGSAVGGSVSVYRNLFDLRRPTVGIRPRPPVGTTTPPQVMRYGQFFKSNAPDGPLDLFHNTIVVTRQSIVSSYALYRNYLGEHPRRSFNNIFIAVNPTGESDLPIGHIPLPTLPAALDGNCYHRVGRSTAPLLVHKSYRLGDHTVPAESLRDLAALRRSPIFADSRVRYPPGFEAHGTDEDPRFRRFGSPGKVSQPEDLRLATDSPARARGVRLPDELRHLDGDPPETRPDIGCFRFGSQPLFVGVDGRRTFPGNAHRPPVTPTGASRPMGGPGLEPGASCL